jgi:hypothetical protein
MATSGVASGIASGLGLALALSIATPAAQAAAPQGAAPQAAPQGAPPQGARGGGQGGRGGGQQAAPSGRAAAPIDLTGYWVSLVTDDWRWRMVTPPKGDVNFIPVTDAARRAAEQWDPAKDEAAGEACKGYGAGGIMRLPGRLHVTWDGDNVLKIETDNGTQTRLLNFGAAPPPSEASWQGFSVATWELPGGGRGRRGGGAPGPRPGSSLKVLTTRMRPGYWQKNGVPYSGNAVMTEWFTTISEPDGNAYLLVTKLLEDPQYIQGAYYRTVQFKKQNDATGWNPTACSAK